MLKTNPFTRGFVFIIGLAVAAMAANLYYSQPLAVLISSSLGLEVSKSGLVVTFTHMGYGLGVLFLVPLADLFENRILVLVLISLTAISLLGIGLSEHLHSYFFFAFLLGIGSCGIQIVMPYVAHFAPEAQRGQLVGSLVGGVMLGIMFSRPLAGFIADHFSWHTVYFMSSAVMILLVVLLLNRLPPRQPRSQNLRYLQLLKSMTGLLLNQPVLRRRALYQACMFCSFCLFWTAAPMVLAGPAFSLSQSEIALFALAGISGAALAPIAGRMADRGHTQLATALAFVSGIGAFLLSILNPLGSTLSLVFLTLCAIFLDAGVSSNLVLGQRAIFALSAESRGRLNSLYIAIIFVGGSLGSYLGAHLFTNHGWSTTACVGLLFPAFGFLIFLRELLSSRTERKA